MYDTPNCAAYSSEFQKENIADERATQSLMRTVDHLKSTTTNMRGFADSVDHLLNALEEFYPFIDKFLSSTQSLRNTMGVPQRSMYGPHRKRR